MSHFNYKICELRRRPIESHNQPHKYLDLNIKSVGITTNLL
ncbi:hypothetical protein [Leptospira noguchii]|nr:hypothetical protein [Leptospira noguchii]